MYYFYMRVSADGEKKGSLPQTFDRQKLIFENAGYDMTEENTFAERVSVGKSSETIDEFSRMKSLLNEGDTVVFTEPYGFAKNYTCAMMMIDDLLMDCGVNVKFIESVIELLAGDKMDPYQWYMIAQLILTDELQRRIIIKRSKRCLPAKNAKAAKIGRPFSIDDDVIQNMRIDRSKGMKVQEIAEKYGVSISSVSNACTKKGGFKNRG